ncbi:protein of unknown function [Xenorhabdus doucetiae]|uniref:Uncharacterized protein n=1 Tax=Xenorhabdus doucetiae TaxID=351671 RepID=A0A068QUL7_9GAMM|nr:protein of unknown function [Xenorhabdus doucetiae]
MGCLNLDFRVYNNSGYFPDPTLVMAKKDTNFDDIPDLPLYTGQ